MRETTKRLIFRIGLPVLNKMAAVRGIILRTSNLYSCLNRNPTIRYLPKHLNVAYKSWNSVTGRFCSNLVGNSSNIDPKIETHVESRYGTETLEKRNISVEKILSDFGVPLSKVRKQMDITRLSLERVKEKVEFLSGIGMNNEDIGKILTRRPSVLVARNEDLLARVEALKKAGIQPGALVYSIRRSPGILTAKTENTIIPKVNYLLDLAVKPRLTKEEVLHMLTKCPDVIATCSLDSIKSKIHFLEKVLKFNQQQLRNIILKQPTVLTFSPESMKSKFAYCYNELNASRSSIARCPRVFQCSLKRIKERHQFLLKVGRLREEMVIDDYGLGVIATQTDKYFADNVALSTLEEFNNFRMTLTVNE